MGAERMLNMKILLVDDDLSLIWGLIWVGMIILSKTTILDRLWDSNGNYIDYNTLAVYVRRLQIKIKTDPNLSVSFPYL